MAQRAVKSSPNQRTVFIGVSAGARPVLEEKTQENSIDTKAPLNPVAESKLPQSSSGNPVTKMSQEVANLAKNPARNPVMAATENKSGRLIAFGLLTLALTIIGFALWETVIKKPVKPKAAAKKEVEKIEQIVNKHLVMTNTKIEIEQKRKNIELRERIHNLGDTIHPQQIHKPATGVDLSPDKNEFNAINDLRNNDTDINYQAPDKEILRQMADRENQAAEEKAYREAYQQAAIQEARRQGFELQFAPDGTILGAKPIGRTPQGSQNIYPGTPSVSQ